MIRQFRNSDLAAIRELHVLGLDQTGTNLGPGPWDDDLEDIQAVYLRNKGDFLVAETRGRIVGMGALRRRSEDEAEIKRMRVHPEKQRQGVGRSILKELEARAGKLGYARIILDTTVQQVGAMALYRSAGYTEIGRATNHGLECVIFEKRLAKQAS